MSILTTVLSVITSEHITTGGIEETIQFCLKVLSPLKYICVEHSILTNRLKTNSGSTSCITNTTVFNGNTENFTSVLTKLTNNCFTNSTITFAVDDNSWRRSISVTRSNNSDGYDTTINDDWLGNRTFTRVEFDVGRRCVTRTRCSNSNTLNRTTYFCCCSCTRTITTRDRHCRRRGISLTRCLNKNLTYNTISNNCSCSSAETAATNNRYQRLCGVSCTTIGNVNREQRTVNCYICSSTRSFTTCDFNEWFICSIITSTSISNINTGNTTKLNFRL